MKSLTAQVESFIEGDGIKKVTSLYDNFPVDVVKTRVSQGVLPYDILLGKLQALGWEIKCNNPEATATLKAARHYASE